MCSNKGETNTNHITEEHRILHGQCRHRCVENSRKMSTIAANCGQGRKGSRTSLGGQCHTSGDTAWWSWNLGEGGVHRAESAGERRQPHCEDLHVMDGTHDPEQSHSGYKGAGVWSRLSWGSGRWLLLRTR